jgi:hypothetical protein
MNQITKENTQWTLASEPESAPELRAPASRGAKPGQRPDGGNHASGGQSPVQQDSVPVAAQLSACKDFPQGNTKCERQSREVLPAGR